tara:strand:+ start:1353 stop:1811 length:459 start_codon:yes stop_codon:yes gene_type:complete
MHEITYWILFIVLTLLALPLIFLIGIMASGLILIAIVLATIFWGLNLQVIQPHEILLIFSLFLLSLFSIYFIGLLIFATLGFLIYKFKSSLLTNPKEEDFRKKSLKYFANVFFSTTKSLVKKFKWLIWGLLPIIIILSFLTHQEFSHNEFWI